MSMSAAPSPEASPETSHAGLMDQVYQYQRYLYDFTRKYYLFGRDSLIADLGLAPGDRLVEIGCGTARNLIAIARAYPEARLFGLDASAAMLETAQAQIEKAGLEGRIRLIQGLAEALDPAAFGQEAFENILFSYSLSMIPDWRRALAAGMASLGPQGRVNIVDFGDFRTLPGRGALRAWLRHFHVTPRAQLLAELEGINSQAPDFGLRQNDRLTVLPGRYAFRYSGTKI